MEIRRNGKGEAAFYKIPGHSAAPAIRTGKTQAPSHPKAKDSIYKTATRQAPDEIRLAGTLAGNNASCKLIA